MILTIKLIDLTLKFQVLDNPIAKLWIERMHLRNQWPLDDPTRFYGFYSQQQDQLIALKKIQQCITSINSWQPLIDRSLTSVHDQDTLNYLHNIFEQWHGLLDQRPAHPRYGPIPDTVRSQLSDLNVGVHRCESSARGNRPRFVCTWFGMPKTKTLTIDDMQKYGTLDSGFGTVCLNYAEIGKTLEDLTQDRDNYISDTAFKPFNHYSADFVVRMYQETAEHQLQKLDSMKDYYIQHQDFFVERGYTMFWDPRLLPLRFPVASLIETLPRDQLIKAIAQQQHITQVSLQ
jgi:hypothetical protein